MADDHRVLWQLLPWGDNEVSNIPKKIVIHCMGEYLDIDQVTAKKFGVPPGVYHASMWLNTTKLSAHALVAPTGVIIRHRKDNEGLGKSGSRLNTSSQRSSTPVRSRPMNGSEIGTSTRSPRIMRLIRIVVRILVPGFH